MNEAPVYFDATEKRVREMTTYTLSTYHTLIRKLVVLASMDCEGECFTNCVLFFQTLVAALSEKFQVSELFDPKFLLLDEKSCNWLALATVFGEGFIQGKAISCEFHYQQSVNKRCDSGLFVDDASKREFKTLAMNVLKAETVPMFEAASQNLKDFIDCYYKDDLSDWFKWWQDHKTHVFRSVTIGYRLSES